MNRVAWTFVSFGLVVGLTACGAAAQEAETEPAPQAQEAEAAPAPDTQEVASTGDGFYTQEQADRGEATFQEVCSYCHAEAEFSGRSFLRAWEGAPVGQFFSLVSSTMPYDGPGSLPAQQYADVVAYILSLNDLPAGESELPADAQALSEIRIQTPSQSD